MNSLDMIKEFKEFSHKLHELHIDKGSILTIPLQSEAFRKLDEDLFYRQNKEGDTFIPSDDLIELQIDNLSVKFMRYE